MQDDDLLPVGTFVFIGGQVDTTQSRDESIQGGGLTQAEVKQLIDASVAAIYERAYNEALDDVCKVLAEGLEIDDLTYRLNDLRKKCFDSSLLKQ